MNYVNTKTKHLFLVFSVLFLAQACLYLVFLGSRKIVLDFNSILTLSSVTIIVLASCYFAYDYIKKKLLSKETYIIAHPLIDEKITNLFKKNGIEGNIEKIKIIGNESINFKSENGYVFVTLTCYDNLDQESELVHNYIFDIINGNLKKIKKIRDS